MGAMQEPPNLFLSPSKRPRFLRLSAKFLQFMPTNRHSPSTIQQKFVNEWINSGGTSHRLPRSIPLQQWCVRSLWFLFPMILQPAWVNTHANEPTIIRFSRLARNPDRTLPIPWEWLKISGRWKKWETTPLLTTALVVASVKHGHCSQKSTNDWMNDSC